MVNNDKGYSFGKAGSTNRSLSESTLDAAELMNVGCNCLRECIIPAPRVIMMSRIPAIAHPTLYRIIGGLL